MTRTQPSCNDTAARSGSSGPLPDTSSVEPPPMSRTRNGPSAGSRSATAPAIERRPSARPVSSSGTRPVTSAAAARNSSPLEASRRRRGGGQATPRHTQVVHDRPELAQHGQVPLDGLRGQTTGGVDALAEAGDAHQALHRPATGVRHQQSGRVGPTVDGGDGRSGVHGPLLPPSGRQAAHLARGDGIRGVPDQAGCRPTERAVHSPTGSSAPVSHHARWACRHLTP